MGRTEADRKITSEPWPSMQRRKKTEKNEREKLFSVTRGSALKKSLTGPTLLEMSGNPTYRAGRITSGYPVYQGLTSSLPLGADYNRPVSKC